MWSINDKKGGVLFHTQRFHTQGRRGRRIPCVPTLLTTIIIVPILRSSQKISPPVGNFLPGVIFARRSNTGVNILAKIAYFPSSPLFFLVDNSNRKNNSKNPYFFLVFGCLLISSTSREGGRCYFTKMILYPSSQVFLFWTLAYRFPLFLRVN